MSARLEFLCFIQTKRLVGVTIDIEREESVEPTTSETIEEDDELSQSSIEENEASLEIEDNLELSHIKTLEM